MSEFLSHKILLVSPELKMHGSQGLGYDLIELSHQDCSICRWDHGIDRYGAGEKQKLRPSNWKPCPAAGYTAPAAAAPPAGPGRRRLKHVSKAEWTQNNIMIQPQAPVGLRLCGGDRQANLRRWPEAVVAAGRRRSRRTA